MKIEVSKMTRLLTVTREGELSGVFPHQVLESLQRHNLPERSVYRLRSGFHSQNFCSFIRQMGVEPHRCKCRSHLPTFRSCIYNLAKSYVQVKLFVRLLPIAF